MYIVFFRGEGFKRVVSGGGLGVRGRGVLRKDDGGMLVSDRKGQRISCVDFREVI